MERVVIVDGDTDPADAVAAFDVALYVPLESDGMSRVLFEYLAAGRAVIASRVGVVPEVLTDGENALLVPGGGGGPACRGHRAAPRRRARSARGWERRPARWCERAAVRRARRRERSPRVTRRSPASGGAGA